MSDTVADTTTVCGNSSDLVASFAVCNFNFSWLFPDHCVRHTRFERAFACRQKQAAMMQHRNADAENMFMGGSMSFKSELPFVAHTLHQAIPCRQTTIIFIFFFCSCCCVATPVCISLCGWRQEDTNEKALLSECG